MLFNSWTFLVYFLPLVVTGFYLIPIQLHVTRKLGLILASLIFYGYWKLEYVPLLLVSILFNYGMAETIIRCSRAKEAKIALIFSVAANLLLLGYFKYTNFAISSFGKVVHCSFEHVNIILPLAISFFTFTQISYLVDVYRNRELHYGFLDYSLFVVFFPHLIAGPIIRHWEVIPQFASSNFRGNSANFSVGMTLFVMGLGKKILADCAAVYADSVYNGAAQHMLVSTLDAWIGTVAFALQIYFDFSSYSDMAIGLARIFGIRFPHNFDSPYKATSVIVFWERWHCTLTRFLREYVYYSLGGNRRGHVRQIFNILATMLLSGLWHGAGWTFVLWGGLHGTYLVINHQWRRWLAGMDWKPARWIYAGGGGGGGVVLLTFVATCIGWVFFRAANLHAAVGMLVPMLAVQGISLPDQLFVHGTLRDNFLSALHFHFVDTNDLKIKNYGIAALTLTVLLFICWFTPNTQQLLSRYNPILEPVTRPSPFHIKLGLCSGLILGITAYFVIRSSYVTEPSPFIYFNF